MIPGVDPRQMKQMMRQMGMSQEELDASEIIIRTKSGKELIFSNPSVQKIKMQGQETFQISGPYVESEPQAQITISEDDIEMVAAGAKVSKEIAKKTLEEVDGDIAHAIVNLTE